MIVSNNLLESLWARVDTNIGARIKQISELLTQALSANAESTSARDAAVAAEQTATTAATNAASSEAAAKSAESSASSHAQSAQESATSSLSAAERAEFAAEETIQQVEGDFATRNYVDNYVDQRVPIDSFTGTGSPEGKVAAPIGSVYTDSAATTGAIRWIKTSGSGSTGWRVEYGDTGWRIIDNLMGDGWSGRVSIRRIGDQVRLRANGATTTVNTTSIMVSLPSGMNPEAGQLGIWRGSLHELSVLPTPFHRVYYGASDLRVGSGAENKPLYGELTWLTSETWPTSLPGTPA